MIFDRPIIIEKQDEDTEEWKEFIKLHANVNRASQKEDFKAGATQSVRSLKFEVRWCKPLKDIINNTQIYRIKYDGIKYNIVDTDDYMEKHRTLKMIGNSC